jgi:hypothetical protein
MRAPRNLPSAASTRQHAAVESEIAQEKAAALSRMGQRLEGALAALAAFDAERADADRSVSRDDVRRDELVTAAGEALWYYVVQREACGLRDAELVMRELRVPREVQLRMGTLRRR